MAITVQRYIPKDWRIGQFWFNFLSWLNSEKGYAPEYESTGSQMADPFYIPNADFEKLLDEYHTYLAAHEKSIN